jgi:acyl-homoserine lactone acylase PvdQ
MFSAHRNLVVWLNVCVFASSPAALTGEPESPAERFEIRRTNYGIPHILADDLASAVVRGRFDIAPDVGRISR